MKCSWSLCWANGTERAFGWLVRRVPAWGEAGSWATKLKELGIPWLLRSSLEPGIVSEDGILLLASSGLRPLGIAGAQSRAVKPGQSRHWPWGSLLLPGCLLSPHYCVTPLPEAGKIEKVQILFLGGSFCKIISVLTLVSIVCQAFF